MRYAVSSCSTPLTHSTLAFAARINVNILYIKSVPVLALKFRAPVAILFAAGCPFAIMRVIP